MTLQISLAPPDLRHVSEVLPHQLRVWAGQVDEIVCAVDLRPPPAADAQEWDELGHRLVALVGSCLGVHPAGRICLVDYTRRRARAVADTFFGGRAVPAKDFRGGPFYAYFDALLQARHDHVMHLDSDMLFGGASKSWVSEALALLAVRPDAAACRPLPGPPTHDDNLRDQDAERDPGTATFAFRFKAFTTRCFLVDRRRLVNLLAPLAVRWHPPPRALAPWEHLPDALGRAPLVRCFRPVLTLDAYDLPERLIGEAMGRAGHYRLDLLGEAPGMWSLHPRFRTPRFYDALPRLIERVERGNVTDDQLGRYDLQESMLA